MSLRSVLCTFFIGATSLLAAFHSPSAPAAELIHPSPPASTGFAIESSDFPDIELHPIPIPSALETDVAGNPVFTAATKNVLIQQIRSDFDEFDQPGIDWRSEFGGDHEPTPDDARPSIALASILVTDPIQLVATRRNCGAAHECELPLDYNVQTASVRLVYPFSSLAVRDQFRDYIDEENRRRIEITVNGRRLVRRDVGGVFIPFDQDYDFDAELQQSSVACPFFYQAGCIVATVRRDAWYGGPAPWPKWHVRLEGVQYDERGRVRVVEEATERVVSPKATLKDYFTATIAQSTMSARCTTCHDMDTVERIQQRHHPIQIPAQSVFPSPSIVNDGEVINHCTNCHEADLPQDFHETRWATPTPAQDLHWGNIINNNPDSWPMEICNRIVGNLETPEDREEHFHEDARLFWAVASGITPFDEQLPTAHPKDYDDFLDHFDVWNSNGAACPVPEPSNTAGLVVASGWLFVLARRARRSH